MIKRSPVMGSVCLIYKNFLCFVRFAAADLGARGSAFDYNYDSEFFLTVSIFLLCSVWFFA